jgi:hypothetical protein
MCTLVINLQIVNSGLPSCHARSFWSYCDNIVYFFFQKTSTYLFFLITRSFFWLDYFLRAWKNLNGSLFLSPISHCRMIHLLQSLTFISARSSRHRSLPSPPPKVPTPSMGRYHEHPDGPSSSNRGSQRSKWRRVGASSSSSTGEKAGLPELDLLHMRRQTSTFG